LSQHIDASQQLVDSIRESRFEVESRLFERFEEVFFV